MAWLSSLSFLCVSGFHRNEDMKAIDVLPILKEKVAFLSGQIHAILILHGSSADSKQSTSVAK